MQPAQEETNSNGAQEETTCHANRLHKRHHANCDLSDATATSDAQHLLRPESPSLTPERISSSVDFPAVLQGNGSRFSTPNSRKLRKPPPLSPYRSTSAGANNNPRSLGSRQLGNNSIHDNLTPNCKIGVVSPGYDYTTNSPTTGHRKAGYLGNRNLEGRRPRRNTVIYANLVIAILLTMCNIAFINRESLLAVSSPSNLPAVLESKDSASSSNKNKRRKKDIKSIIRTSQGRGKIKSTTAVPHLPRIVCLGCTDHLSSIIPPFKYAIDVYSSEFSDVTQLYPKFPSNDILPIKSYDPLVNDIEGYGNCVPVNSSWQSTFHPTCNAFHELDLKVGLRRKSVDLFGFKGFWRHAWKIIDDDYLSGYLNKRFLSKFVYNGNLFNRHTQSSTFATMARVGLSAELPHVVLKTLRFEHNYEELIYEINRIDAVAMERLTPSPHVMDIYGFCGMSAITEFGQGNFKSVVDEATPLEKLKYARDVASGLASAHYIDGYDGNVTLAHNDLNPSNVMMNHGNAKLNDFNVGIMMTWNEQKNQPCRFKSLFANAQWRAPEEQFIDGEYSNEPLSEKIDVYALGNIFFRIIAGHDPWKEYKIDGRISSEDQNDIAKRKRFNGDLPKFLDPDVVDTSIPATKAIYDVMMKCFQKLPKDRPTAVEIQSELSQAYISLTKHNLSATKDDKRKTVDRSLIQF